MRPGVRVAISASYVYVLRVLITRTLQHYVRPKLGPLILRNSTFTYVLYTVHEILQLLDSITS